MQSKIYTPDFGEQEQTAFKAVAGLLAIPLDAYRKKEVIRLIKSQNENVETLLSFLRDPVQ